MPPSRGGPQRSARELFDAEADGYVAKRYGDPPRGFEQHAYALRRAHALALLDEARPSPSAVLDLGCGPGVLSAPLLERGHDVVGVDASARMLAAARRTVAAHPRVSSVRLLRADALRLPFANARFDAVMCLGVVSYVADVRALLDEIARVLAPGGAAIVQLLRAGAPLAREREVERALSRALAYLTGSARAPRPTPVSRDVGEVIARAAAAGLRLERARAYDFRPLLLHRVWLGDAARASAALEVFARVPGARALSAGVVCAFTKR